MLSRQTLRRRSRKLNRKNFPSEAWFERLLFQNQIGGYERNPPLLNRYFGDFVWFGHRIIVEIDGKSHIGKEDYDARRDAELTAAGFFVCRIKMGDTDFALKVIERLRIKIAEPLPPRVYPRHYPLKVSRPRKKSKQKHGQARKMAKCYTDDNRRMLDDLNLRKSLWTHPKNRT